VKGFDLTLARGLEELLLFFLFRLILSKKDIMSQPSVYQVQASCCQAAKFCSLAIDF
jgi:hypothetical protein